MLLGSYCCQIMSHRWCAAPGSLLLAALFGACGYKLHSVIALNHLALLPHLPPPPRWQVLLSLQGQVLVEEPYFNYPQPEEMKGSAEAGTRSSK